MRFLPSAFTLPLLLLVAPLLLNGCSEGVPSAGERYFRAVYVLRSLGGPAAAEHEDIPRRVVYSDETESLLHHPDTIFVLKSLAADLAALRQEHPRAMLYEAYARLGLGEKEKAAGLLMRYVVENEYRSDHYALLSDNLASLEDYSSLLLICREWQERDPSCREERSLHLFAALYNLGRYQEAREGMRRDRCLGWRARVYEAKAALRQGDEAEARDIIAAAMRDYSGNAAQIRRLWDLVRDREKV